MNVTIVINEVCASGNHILMTARTPRGNHQFTLTRADWTLDEPAEYQSALLAVLRSFVKSSGLIGNPAALRSAIESHTFVI